MAYLRISKNLTRGKINYIARDPYGIVRLRAKTRKKLEKMVKEYKVPRPEEIEKELEERGVETPVPVIPTKVEEEKPKTRKPRKKRKTRKKRKAQGKKKAAPEVKKVASLGKLEVPPKAGKEEVKEAKLVEEIIEKEEKPKEEETKEKKEETKTAPETKKKSPRRRKRKTAQKKEKTPRSKFFGYEIK